MASVGRAHKEYEAAHTAPLYLDSRGVSKLVHICYDKTQRSIEVDVRGRCQFADLEVDDCSEHLLVRGSESLRWYRILGMAALATSFHCQLSDHAMKIQEAECPRSLLKESANVL